jgi:hypothetical protein
MEEINDVSPGFCQFLKENPKITLEAARAGFSNKSPPQFK